MEKEQIIEKMKQHPKRTALIAVLLVLLLHSLLSDGGSSNNYDDPKDAPYGRVTWDALHQERTGKPAEPAIESPIYMAVMSEINMFLGKGNGQLFATIDMPEKIEVFVCKPATYASKVVIKNITPQQTSLGSANGCMEIHVLKPFGVDQREGLELAIGGGSNNKDFWNIIFYDKLDVKYAKEKQMEIKMPERHTWKASTYPGQLVAEITPDQFVKISYLGADGKEVKSVTTKEKAVAFRLSASDIVMSSHIEFYR